MVRSDSIKAAQTISDKCIECNLCRKECGFLQKYGNPKSIADSFFSAGKGRVAMAFECSLCRLCEAVCPVGLNPSGMFLKMRREAVRQGRADFSNHSRILNYEKRGTSRRYSFYGLPDGCEAVFFPGCALSGTRPDDVTRLFFHLRKRIPALGIVLDCCTKPSHDLGRESYFQAMFGEMRAWLLENGVRTVLVACPSCHQVFKEYGGGLHVKSVYELLAEEGLLRSEKVSGVVALHDSCAVRFEKSIHEAARSLVKISGLTIDEMPHCRNKTLCCGEGGAVGFVSPELSKSWGETRRKEAAGRKVVTYCAGCAATLGKRADVSHLLDLLFEPESALSGKIRGSRAPFTYWNRIRLKARFKKLTARGAQTRERTFRA